MDNLSLQPEDVDAITTKVFPKGSKKQKTSNIRIIEKKHIKDLSVDELEMLHSYYHTDLQFLNSNCMKHFIIANEMLDRGLQHVDRSVCDKSVTLYRNLDINISNLTDEDLVDYTRIVLSWYNTIVKKKKNLNYLNKLTTEILKPLKNNLLTAIRNRNLAIYRNDKHKMSMEEFYDNAPQHIIIDEPYVYYSDGKLAVFDNDSSVTKALKISQPNNWSSELSIEDYNTSTKNYPLYKYGLFKVPKSEFIKDICDYVKPFATFTPPKPVYYNRNELSDFSKFYYDWIVKRLSNGLIIQKNHKGLRCMIHKKGDIVKIFPNDLAHSESLIKSIDEIKSINHDFIIDTTLVSYNCNNKEVKSASLKMLCDVSDINGNIDESTLVFHINDIVFLDGETLCNISLNDRIEKLNIFNKNMMYLSITNTSPVVTDYSSLMAWIDNIDNDIIFKVSSSTYPIKQKKNKTSDWIITNLYNTELNLLPCDFKADINICPILREFSVNKSIDNVKCKLSNARKCYYKV